MIGFVSALSSSLAVIILIMAVMMMNMLKSALDSEQAKENPPVATFQLDEEIKEALGIDGEEEDGEGDGGSGTLELNPNVVSQDVKNMLHKKRSLKTVTPYCTYGNNFDYAVAAKYTTFNVIALSRSVRGVQIVSKKPVLDEVNDNRCYIDYE